MLQLLFLFIPKLEQHYTRIDASHEVTSMSQVMTINMIHGFGGEGANYKEDG